MEIPRNIDGPVSLYIFHIEEINKMVLLFGDRHTLPKYTCEPGEYQEGCGYEGCETVIDFLEKTFNKSETCIDFFLETDFLSPLSPRYEGGDVLIVNVENRFHECFQSKKCPEHTRLHYSDLRMHIRENILLYLFPGLEKEIKDIKSQFQGRKEIIPDYSELKQKYNENKLTYDLHFAKTIMYITGLSDERPPLSIPKQSLDIFNFHRRKVQKQWNALPKNLVERVKQTMKDLVDKYFESSNMLRTNFIESRGEGTGIEDIEVVYSKLRLFMAISMSIIMDVYLLLRMLRKDLNDSHIAIVYAGNIHIESYKVFLYKTFRGCDVVYQTDAPPGSKCIKIPENIVEKVRKITSQFPKSRCLTRGKTPVKNIESQKRILSLYFDQNIKMINSCLKQTSSQHKMSEEQVLQNLDKALKAKGKFLLGYGDEICDLNSWSKSIKDFGSHTVELREDKLGNKFVIKFYDEEEDNMTMAMWKAEVNAYRRVEHYKPKDSNFVDFYRYADCSEDLKMIFMEDVGKLTLTKYIENLNKKEWMDLLLTLAKNVKFLESIGVNHRDFHPSNMHVVNGKIKIFDFGLSVGKPLKGKVFGKGWTVTDWGGNFMGEFVNPKFLLGFDLHDFLASMFIRNDMFGGVPNEILRDLVFPYLKSLNEKEIEELDKLGLDDPPYTEITFEGKSKTIPMNLYENWLPTSGKSYYKTINTYKKKSGKSPKKRRKRK